jgi:hypothetical protein
LFVVKWFRLKLLSFFKFLLRKFIIRSLILIFLYILEFFLSLKVFSKLLCTFNSFLFLIVWVKLISIYLHDEIFFYLFFWLITPYLKIILIPIYFPFLNVNILHLRFNWFPLLISLLFLNVKFLHKVFLYLMEFFWVSFLKNLKNPCFLFINFACICILMLSFILITQYYLILFQDKIQYENFFLLLFLILLIVIILFYTIE